MRFSLINHSLTEKHGISHCYFIDYPLQIKQKHHCGNYGDLTASRSHFQLNLCPCLCLGKVKKKKARKRSPHVAFAILKETKICVTVNQINGLSKQLTGWHGKDCFHLNDKALLD